MLLAAVAAASGAAVPASPAAAQAADGTGRVLLRQLYGDVAVELRTAPGQSIRIGAAGGSTTVTLTVLARDLRRWSDSAARVLSARAPRRTRAGEWRATVEGPGLAAGAMTLTRAISGRDTTVSVYFADSAFVGVRLVPGSAAEARAFVAAMRRAAAAVLAPPARRKPPPARRKPPPGAAAHPSGT